MIGDSRVTVVDLLDVSTDAGGAIWSLPHDGDLDANLVRLHPDQEVAEHVNSEVDVLVSVRAGTGEIVIDDRSHALTPDSLVLVPRSSARRIVAGPGGISYLSIHRARGPLSIGGSEH